MPKKFIPKFLKIILITIGVIFVSLFTLLAIWGFFAVAGGTTLVRQLFNEVVLQNYSDRTTLTPVNSTTNKLTSAADYTVDIPVSYRILHEAGFSSDPLSITLGNETGEIKISRDSAEGNNLNEYLKPKQIYPSDAQELSINGEDAIKGRDVRGQYVYYVYVKKIKPDDESWVFWISTEDKKLLPDLDKIAQSFKYNFSN
jgi:hypothetical protein